MKDQMTRRELFAALGASGLVMGLGMVPGRTFAAEDSGGLDYSIGVGCRQYIHKGNGVR